MTKVNVEILILKESMFNHDFRKNKVFYFIRKWYGIQELYSGLLVLEKNHSFLLTPSSPGKSGQH